MITSVYDPMLAKVAAWGPDRPAALRRLDAALREMTILGVTTNVAFLRGLLADPDVQAGRLDTGLIGRLMANPPKAVPDAVLAAAALLLLPADVFAVANAGAGGDRVNTGEVTDPWDIRDGWRVGERAWARLRLAAGPGSVAEVRVRGLAAGAPARDMRAGAEVAGGRAGGLAAAGAQVVIGDGEPVAVRGERSGDELFVEVDGKALTFRYALDGRTAWLGRDGLAWAFTEVPAAGKRGGAAGGADGTVRSPMPGTVLAVRAGAGDTVAAGQPLAVIEAMKMEHTVTAPLAGIVAELPVRAGQQVQMDETLAVIKEASDV